MHQLIILGNGFDLTCGLKSKFAQFYGDRTSSTFSFDSIPDDQQNVWDLILSKVGRGDPLWCDIENLISLYVFREGKSDPIITKMYNPGVRTINLDGPTKPFRPDDEIYDFATRSLGKTEVSQSELTSYLLSSLKEYEYRFACYLEKQVFEDKAYADQAQRYFAAIHDSRLSDSQRHQISSAILSFNYTTPFRSNNKKLGIETVRNVHGVLGETETIFGIDGKEVGEDDPALPFTKTYRLLSLETHGDGQLIKLNDGGTNYIKVFGHSLAPADYSYFQSIFDAVDLYGGSTTLVFLYKSFSNMPDGTVDEQAIREDLYKRISHLMIEYGSTLDNKDHGKNLMHKLLLERRLIIERIDKPSIMPSNIYLK